MFKVQMIPVQSSHMKAVGYYPRTQTLTVEFLDNALYHYYNVPESIYNGLLAADSKGSYLASYIKDIYRYQKVS